MKEELRKTRPIGVCKIIPVVDEDPTAHKYEIDWSFFTFDSNRRVYIRKPMIGHNPDRDALWVYTEEFMKKWEDELENKIFVMRDDAKEILGFIK